VPTPTSISPGTYGSGFSTTVADTTTSSVTAGNKIIGVVTWWGGAGFSLSSVAGGALTWTIDRQNTGTGYRMALISADAPSGLASSTAITATFTGSSEARGIRFLQVDGLANNPTAADGTADLPHQTGSSFSIAITVGTSGDFVVGAGWVDFNTTGASWTSPATEIGTDWTNVDGGSYSWAYKTGVSSGSQAMAGTNGGNDFTGIAAAYLVSGGGGGGGTVDGSPTPMRPGFMSGTAFPSFMDAPNIAGWSPFGMAYDLGTGGPQAYTSPQTATVGFTGADAVRTSKGLTAATVGFTGSLTRAVVHILTAAALAFTGSLTKRLARALTATVSFTGAIATAAVHSFTQALTASLSFTGAQSRRVGKGIAATLSFTGAQAKATAVSKSATVSFTGAQTRRVGTTLTAAVSFTGAQTRRSPTG
jgi:hypothetical protein